MAVLSQSPRQILLQYFLRFDWALEPLAGGCRSQNDVEALPLDFKPMLSVGRGAYEIRVHILGEWRVIYVAKFKQTAYVLHAFQKKVQKSSQISSARSMAAFSIAKVRSGSAWDPRRSRFEPYQFVLGDRGKMPNASAAYCRRFRSVPR